MSTHRLIPFGLSGTNVTVSEANRLAREGSRDPEIITLARRILVGGDIPERNHWAEVVAIHNFVKSHSRYTNDSIDGEVLTSIKGPLGLMAMYRQYGSIAGDCDDLCIFEAALLRSIGINTRFVTLSRAERNPMNRMQHIYLEASVDGEWVPLDPILKRRPAGYAAPNYTAKKVYDRLGDLAMFGRFAKAGGNAIARATINDPNLSLNRRGPLIGNVRGLKRGRFMRRSVRGQLVKPVMRRTPKFHLHGTDDGYQEQLGALSIFKPLKATFTRLYGSEEEKAKQREANRIATATAIFDKAAAGEAVPLTGDNSLAYAVGVFKKNGLPIPAGIPQDRLIQAQKAAASGGNTMMIVMVGAGALILAKVLRIF